ncbi:MAG: protein-L-isoaspartate(D-aspartate) O-methyltransferase [Paracoccaceae bacterium]|jgi:protein-L-isoaspartate(D-aspartate) O-methyltransferase
MNKFEALRKTMVDTQVRPSGITRGEVIDAMNSIPRELFLPESLADLSYVEHSIGLRSNRFLVDPRTLAKLLESAKIKENELVLVVASGCGYSSAVIGFLAEAVVALESDEDFIVESDKSLTNAGIDNVIVIHGALGLGASQHGPYDVIILEGSVDEIPAPLIDQIKDKGRILAFFKHGTICEAKLGIKSQGVISWRVCFSCYVPQLKELQTQEVFVL